MSKCIKCGSYAFNLYKDNIDQGSLCDVHYWQGRAHRAENKQEQGEPVAWGNLANWCLDSDRVLIIDKEAAEEYHRNVYDLTPLYTTPQQRTWVGLTEEERNDMEDFCEMIIGKVAFDAIEAKLRSKNERL